MRRVFALGLVILASAAASTAQGQAAPRRPPPPPARQTVVPAPPPVTPPKPIRAPTAFSVDAGPTCRAQCSKDRYACHGEDDPSDCDTRWLSCLSACRTQ